MACPADVRQYDAVEAALGAMQEAYGEIDILIAGAAGNFPAPALGMSASSLAVVVNATRIGRRRRAKPALPHPHEALA